jgi:hypothetical protein
MKLLTWLIRRLMAMALPLMFFLVHVRMGPFYLILLLKGQPQQKRHPLTILLGLII